MIEPSALPPGTLASCPLLGLPGDQATHYSFSHDGHRCHAMPRPSPIDPTHQAAFCLSANFGRCDVYRSWIASGSGTGGAVGPASGVASRGGPAPLARTTTIDQWATGPRESPRDRSRLPLVALVAVAVVALAALLAGQLLGERPGMAALPRATRTPTAEPSGSPVTSGAPTQVPSASPTASTGATEPPPSVAPTSGPGSLPPPGVTSVHVVQDGEWLSSIAELYGTTVDRLVELNDIEDPDVLEVGQEIRLPPEARPASETQRPP